MRLVFEITAEGERIREFPMRFHPLPQPADQRAVAERAEYGAPFYALKMPHAEKGKGKDDAEEAADAVVSCFEFADADAECGRDFLYEKFVGLRSEVGVEHERHAQGAEQRAGQKEDDTPGVLSV